jgi:hypothetical protein
MREAGWALDGLGEEVWVGGIGGSVGVGRGTGRSGMGASISASQPLVLGQSVAKDSGSTIGQRTSGVSTVIGDKSARLDLRLNGWARCLDGWVDGIVGMLRYVFFFCLFLLSILIHRPIVGFEWLVGDENHVDADWRGGF